MPSYPGWQGAAAAKQVPAASTLLDLRPGKNAGTLMSAADCSKRLKNCGNVSQKRGGRPPKRLPWRGKTANRYTPGLAVPISVHRAEHRQVTTPWFHAFRF
jgi:hypothetical protein